MATWLDSYLSKLEQAKGDVQDDLINMLVEREGEIKQMIKDRWRLGLRPDGSIIGHYKDPDYAIFKQQINPLAGGDVDLIYNRDLVNNIDLIMNSFGAEVISTDEKYTKIANKYGYDNFNITDEQENELLDEIMAQVVINVFNEIWG